MNRFFSKLDLRDIKIDPTGTRFPPDAEEYQAEVEDESALSPENDQEVASTIEEPARQPHVPSWAPERAPLNSHVDGAVAVQQPVVDEVADLPVGDGVVEGQEEPRSGEVLKVSARSRPSAVAGAIAGVVRESGRAEVQAIGAGATNQAVKAVAIARDYLRETGIEAVCLPAFIDVTIDNEDRTAIRLVVEPR
ncbi:MAG: stage sporulation protein [Thermomicrobiales bacterium]|jgi:stage V sporulation protein S|nr:stage sporulation protein [Thermomicrobiales bacterium]